MDEKFQKILHSAGDVFMRYGIRSVTMDDIARELKISKKTLYKYVKDKQDLVVRVMSEYCTQDEKACSSIIAQAQNAIDEIIRVSEFVGQQISQIHSSIHYDLEKYYPRSWDVFYNYKNNYILNCVKANLKRGIEEGLYRNNMDMEIVARLYVEKVDLVFDAAVFPPRQFGFSDVYMELIRYHIRGIASEKGLAYLSKIVNQGLNKY